MFKSSMPWISEVLEEHCACFQASVLELNNVFGKDSLKHEVGYLLVHCLFSETFAKKCKENILENLDNFNLENF